jgi:hypothetical protein
MKFSVYIVAVVSEKLLHLLVDFDDHLLVAQDACYFYKREHISSLKRWYCFSGNISNIDT